MILLNSGEYKEIASATDFKRISSSVKSIDLQFDKDKLGEIKRQFGDGPVVSPEPHRRLYVILTK